jgi:predicted dehydrogenase
MSDTGPRIRVGVIGATPSRGWGTTAHLPALGALPEFEVAAVATTRMETARATASAFGVPLAFADAADLVACAEVDVVAVTVKVPEHDALVRAALAAGKHVFCEWPLGNGLEQAEALASLAEASGVRHIVGLQGYHSPGARYVRELIDQGYIGQPVAVSAVAGGGPAGRHILQASAYATDRAAGATVLTISAGHLLATLARAVGPPDVISAVVALVNRTTTVTETGQVLDVTSPDQVVLAGRLGSGAALSVAVQGGTAPAAAGFELRIVGTEATLAVRAAGGGSIHIADWAISGYRGDGPAQELPVPARLAPVPASVPPGPPRNIARVYRELAGAITEQRSAEPGFATAAGWHRALDAIQRASDTGTSQDLAAG